LTALKGCRDEEDVETALDALPKDLDETYDRILNQIENEKDQTRVRCVFQLLIVSFELLTIDDIAAAITVDVKGEASAVNVKRKMRDPKDILEICSSLVEW
jgi:ankyrin repeat domain-containing protein 50